MVELAETSRSDPALRALYDAFTLEADGPLGEEYVDRHGPPTDLVPPGGAMLLGRVDGVPAAIGGVRHLETEIAEVKSMYVAPAHRGVGLAREVLTELEQIARRHGCRATRLDSSRYLTAAVALYRSAGYEEVPAYNQNPKADVWFERPLTPA